MAVQVYSTLHFNLEGVHPDLCYGRILSNIQGSADTAAPRTAVLFLVFALLARCMLEAAAHHLKDPATLVTKRVYAAGASQR